MSKQLTTPLDPACPQWIRSALTRISFFLQLTVAKNSSAGGHDGNHWHFMGLHPTLYNFFYSIENEYSHKPTIDHSASSIKRLNQHQRLITCPKLKSCIERGIIL